ncbi:MAG: hypothetical protein EBU26_18505 [Verrucomicrobia bacterium]|nr:hypothetical protein [Verrucomicrobiota bacterium]
MSNGSLVSLDGASPTAFTEGAGDGHSSTAIGALRHDGALSMNAYLAEMIFIDSLASTNDRHKIEGYLAQKWNISMGTVLTNANSPVEATSTAWPVSHKPSYALDGVTGSKYFNSDGPGEGLYLYTGPKGVTGFSVTSADYSPRDPTTYILFLG